MVGDYGCLKLESDAGRNKVRDGVGGGVVACESPFGGGHSPLSPPLSLSVSLAGLKQGPCGFARGPVSCSATASVAS